MKILQLCEYSAGICGVYNRVLAESQLLSKNHEVHIFSSNIEKGSGNIASPEDRIDNIIIKRFPIRWKIAEGSGGALFWNFKKEALSLNPDIIITHNFRHPHNNLALKVAKKLQARCFLVTHAPFVEPELRSWKGRLGVFVYDKIFSKINQFDKVIAITKWEYPYLQELGVPQDKITYIPNGIPDLFFKTKIAPFNGKNILFFGRISPIKNIELLISSFKKIELKYPNLSLSIQGPKESGEYFSALQSQASTSRIIFKEPVFALAEKIQALKDTDIFVLPSKREAMPQALIEAMALGKIVLASDTLGARDIIQEGKNGLLFKRDDSAGFIDKLCFLLDKRNRKKVIQMQKQARRTAEQFAWSKVITSIEALITPKS